MDLITALRLGTSPEPAASEKRVQVVSLTGGGGKTSTMRRLAGELVGNGRRVVCTSTTRLAAYEVDTAPGVVLVDGANLPFDEIVRALDVHSQCLLVTPEIVDGGMQKYPGVRADLVDELATRAPACGIDAIVVEADGAKMLPLKAPAEHEPPVPVSTTLLATLAGMDALGRRIEEPFVHRPHQICAALGLDRNAAQRITPAHIADLLQSPSGGRKGLPAAARFLPVLNKAESMPSLAGARIAACRMSRQRTASLVASTGCLTCDPVHERWGPIAIVVLAAGEGSRFGGPKQLATFDGEPMVVRAVKTALSANVTDVVVVTGAHEDQVTSCLNRHFDGPLPGLQSLHNPAWATGQASSIHAALRSLGDEVEAVLFMAADQPYLPAALLRRLVRRWRAGHVLAAPSVDGVVRGSPALFDRSIWPILMRVQGDVGGRELLKRYSDQVGSVAVDGRLLRDVDTPDQLLD